MDERAFRQVREAVLDSPCPFEKALFAGCGQCVLAQRRNLAEREVIACRSAAARADCTALLQRLRLNARFALHLHPARDRLTHAQEMKVQCGGLSGLRRALAGTDEPGDLHELVCSAHRREGGLESLPYAALMQAVAAWQPRRRARRP